MPLHSSIELRSLFRRLGGAGSRSRAATELDHRRRTSRRVASHASSCGAQATSRTPPSSFAVYPLCTTLGRVPRLARTATSRSCPKSDAISTPALPGTRIGCGFERTTQMVCAVSASQLHVRLLTRLDRCISRLFLSHAQQQHSDGGHFDAPCRA